MKTKEEHIQYWLEQAKDDWEAVETLFAGKKYLQSMPCDWQWRLGYILNNLQKQIKF